MRLSWPVRFTHVHLIICWWLCEDEGGGGGQRPGPGCQCSGWVTVLFPAICFSGGGPAVLDWMHRHEGAWSSPPCHSIGIAASHNNMALLAGLPVCGSETGSVQSTRRYIKRHSYTHSDFPSVCRLCVFRVCGSRSWLKAKALAHSQFSTRRCAIKLQNADREFKKMEMIELV